MTKAPNLADLFRLVRYEPDTGKLFWTETHYAMKSDARADRSSPQGYRRIRFRKRDLSAHRVAWAIMTGTWPDCGIDHRNGDRSDNRWSNLRLATNSQNQANRANQTRLPKGVSFHRGVGKYQAQVKRNGKSHYLGIFNTAAEAHQAYLAKAVEYFGEFARAA